MNPSKRPKQTRHGWLCIAARTVIEPQVNKFRKENSIPKEGFHIDHCKRNFIDLFNEWRGGRDVAIRKTRIGRMVRMTFRDVEDVKDWREYHQKHAILQAVSIDQHKLLTKQRRERLRGQIVQQCNDGEQPVSG